MWMISIGHVPEESLFIDLSLAFLAQNEFFSTVRVLDTMGQNGYNINDIVRAILQHYAEHNEMVQADAVLKGIRKLTVDPMVFDML